MSIKVIAFDADDTLWINENYFRQTEEEFFELFDEYLPASEIALILTKIQIGNLPLYGYGIKGLILSMMETAIAITDGRLNNEAVQRILNLGKKMLNQDIELLPGIENVLKSLQPHYRLVVATKGDLLDQERKLRKSGLIHYFHHVEIMSEKDDASYLKLIQHLDIAPTEFLMVGNSLKSDIIPVLNIGGHAIHIPFHITWIHEQVFEQVQHDNFRTFTQAHEILTLLIPESK